jgi:hypothetical protein
MKLYHGSLEIVTSPQIIITDRLLDYGPGFYTTTSAKQAESWVRGKMKSDPGYVNVYEFDMKHTEELKTLWFREPSEEWLDFVMANRTDKSYDHDYDLVYGPVADDRVYASFALYESGVYNKHDLIRELKTYVLVDQLLFHTERSLQFLSFIELKEVKK